MADATEPPGDVLRAYSALSSLAEQPPEIRGEPDGGMRLEVTVTPTLTARWDDLLAVLDLGRAYGLDDSTGSQKAWVSFAPPSARP